MPGKLSYVATDTRYEPLSRGRTGPARRPALESERIPYHAAGLAQA